MEEEGNKVRWGRGNSAAVEVGLGVFFFFGVHRSKRQTSPILVSDVAYSHSLMRAWIQLPSLFHSHRLWCCTGHPVCLMVSVYAPKPTGVLTHMQLIHLLECKKINLQSP